MATLRFLIDMDAPNSKKVIDGILARVDDLDSKLKTPKHINIEDKSAQAALLRTRISADKLRDKLSMSLTMRGTAEAEAKLLALEATADKLDSSLNGRQGIGSAADGVVSSLGNLAGMGTALFNPITIAAGALAAIMSGPLIAALLPITVGFAGLAAVAVPELEKVSAAADKGGKAIAKLPAYERPAALAMKSLHTEWSKLSKAVQPQIMGAFGSALKVVGDVMPVLAPLISAAAKALGVFFGNVDTWLHSSSGKKFLRWLEIDGPKDIARFGSFMWGFAQVVGRTFSWLDHAGNTWWKNVEYTIGLVRAGFSNLNNWLWNDFGLKIRNFFTITVPAAFALFVAAARLTWDNVEIEALKFVSSITGIMGKLPGPLGAPFRTAHKDISVELAGIEGDAARTSAKIQADWDRLHGKKVALTFGLDLPAGVSYPSRHIKGHAAKGVKGAAAGTWLVGEEGPELAWLPRGTHVLPARPTARIMGGLAGGTLDDFTGNFPSGGTIDAATAAMQSAVSAIASSVKGMLNISTSAFGGPIGGGSYGVARWAPDILKALAMLGQPSTWLSTVERRMNQESGGNPYAINLTDSNAAAGDPSRGLMQTIMSTFQAWRSWSLPNNIYNPLANIFAGLNYALHRYGSLAALNRPGGYASGTAGAAPGWAWVGERGPELVNFSGGEHVLDHGTSKALGGYSKGTDLAKLGRELLRGHHSGILDTEIGRTSARWHADLLLASAPGGRHKAHYAKLAAEEHRHLKSLEHTRAAERAYRAVLARRVTTLEATIKAARNAHLPGEAAHLEHKLRRAQRIVHDIDLWTSGKPVHKAAAKPKTVPPPTGNMDIADWAAYLSAVGPTYKTGSWYVPATGPATVHQGEMIFPKDVADAIRSGGMGGDTTIYVQLPTGEFVQAIDARIEHSDRKFNQRVSAGSGRH